MKNSLWAAMKRVALGLSAVLLSAAALAQAPPASKVTYFHNDVSGSPMVATDATGNVVWKETYRPYGDRVKNEVAGSGNKVWFAGKPQDNNTGLSYMGARYYDPVVGRFMGVDPRGVDAEDIHSFNRYAYANNNPYRYVDPDGRHPVVLAMIPIVTAMGTGALISGGFNALMQYSSTGTVQWTGLGGVLDAASDGFMLGGLLGTARSGLASPAVKPAAATSNAVKSGVQILDRDGNVVIASFRVAKGEAQVAAEMIRDGDKLILRGAHIEGNGTLKEALAAAKSFGREQGVKEVVIEGGVRTTGANPGHLPRPITISTGL